MLIKDTRALRLFFVRLCCKVMFSHAKSECLGLLSSAEELLGIHRVLKGSHGRFHTKGQ